jgi:hypothetical protein
MTTEPTEAEMLVAALDRANMPATTLMDALRSSQTTFDDTISPTDPGLPFVTRISDAPLQVAGRLGLDGVWRVSSFLTAVAVESERSAEVGFAKAIDADAFVVMDSKVGEAMIRWALARIKAGKVPFQMVEMVEDRLAKSRFAISTTVH